MVTPGYKKQWIQKVKAMFEVTEEDGGVGVYCHRRQESHIILFLEPWSGPEKFNTTSPH